MYSMFEPFERGVLLAAGTGAKAVLRVLVRDQIKDPEHCGADVQLVLGATPHRWGKQPRYRSASMEVLFTQITDQDAG